MQLVPRYGQRIAEPQCPGEKNRGVKQEESISDVTARRTMDHQPAEADEQKAEKGLAAPLPGRDPRLIREQHYYNESEVCRIENVLVFPTEDEFAEDRECRR